MTIYTIGFAGKPASRFFGLLRDHQIELLVDTRLRPDGQLAGFAKRGDLPFFLSELVGCDYVHDERLAPSGEMLDAYRSDKDWSAYVVRYQRLLRERRVAEELDRTMYRSKRCCFLCSEATPVRCHRRLLVEFLASEWGGVDVIHLV